VFSQEPRKNHIYHVLSLDVGYVVDIACPKYYSARLGSGNGTGTGASTPRILKILQICANEKYELNKRFVFLSYLSLSQRLRCLEGTQVHHDRLGEDSTST
jgi:hypothetical protein